MTHCIKCRRPMKHATPTGMGPVCAKAAGKPVPTEHDRDLFGYDTAKAEQAARERLRVWIEVLTLDVEMANRQAFRLARVERGVWAG